jgi:hypothetical protein
MAPWSQPVAITGNSSTGESGEKKPRTGQVQKTRQDEGR